MPRSRLRQRIVFCDCRDCVDVLNQPLDYAWERAARQTPPPRSLVLLLEGFNSGTRNEGYCCSLDELALPHFDNVSRRGVTSCAAVPEGALVYTLLDNPSTEIGQVIMECIACGIVKLGRA